VIDSSLVERYEGSIIWHYSVDIKPNCSGKIRLERKGELGYRPWIRIISLDIADEPHMEQR
jgi:hypothetical protein